MGNEIEVTDWYPATLCVSELEFKIDWARSIEACELPFLLTPAPNPPTSLPEKFSSDVKIEPPERLTSCLVICFEELLNITKLESPMQGALLIELVHHTGEVIEVWLPKKLCSNLDLNNRTVLVWDQFMNTKLESIGPLNYTPEYWRHCHHG